MTIDREFMTDQQIERLADTIDFSIEPKLIDGWENFTNQTAGSGQIIDGYSIELKDVYSDGNNAVITFAITAPEGVNLQEYDGYPISLQPSNRWDSLSKFPRDPATLVVDTAQKMTVTERQIPRMLSCIIPPVRNRCVTESIPLLTERYGTFTGRIFMAFI